MPVKTIILEIDVEDGEDSTVKELLAYLAYTKRIKKYLWREKEAVSYAASAQAKREAAEKKQPDKHPGEPHHEKPAEPVAAPKPPEPKKAVQSHMVDALSEQLSDWRKQDKLIRLKAFKGKGKMLDIACKIVSQDDASGIVTVYDVDRKVVETVRVTEIEDIHLAL
jgi:hypothetical protein